MGESDAVDGGDVTVDASPGKGTSVRAIVPIMRPEANGDVEPW